MRWKLERYHVEEHAVLALTAPEILATGRDEDFQAFAVRHRSSEPWMAYALGKGTTRWRRCDAKRWIEVEVARVIARAAREETERKARRLESSGCPDEETILDFVAGRLQTDQIALLEHHVDGCSTCLDLIAYAATEVSS
jgi:hypothetical protein